MSEYVGSELELFAHARNWKAYWARQVMPYVRGNVLEVGAGIGANIDVLGNPQINSWWALEPDASLASQIATDYPFTVDVQVGSSQDIHGASLETSFDTILYIDVLEHIEDDRQELVRASRLMAPGGRLVVLAPAHNSLFSPFDQAIGHYRRYDKEMLREISPETMGLLKLQYLDSVGMLASLANRLLLKQTTPTAKQIQIWDRIIVPCSRLLDVLSRHHLGKTIVAIWENSAKTN